MNTLKSKASKLSAVALVLVLSQAYVHADLLKSVTSPAAAALFNVPLGPAGRLTTRGDNPVTVNGTSAKTGETVFSGQQIQTPDKVGATIQIDVLGRVDAAPNTKLTLTFENEKVNVMLVSGCVILTANKDVTGTLQSGSLTKQTDLSKGGGIDVCTSATPGALPVAGQGAAAVAGAGAGGGVSAAATTGGRFGLGIAGTVGLIAAAAAITTIPSMVVNRNNRSNPGPARP